jgi:NAD(P)-dependent dehydrogenase (short-subunit alcohol dehydrogenase family)
MDRSALALKDEHMTHSPQVALVTGGNKGLGYETVAQLAQQGFTVWLGSRDQARGVTAAESLAVNGDIRFISLDVTDQGSVDAAAQRIGRETGLDVLINNAGVAISDDNGRASSARLDALQQTLDVNVFGALRVTQAFLPLIRRSPAGRIVNVSSTLGSLGVVTSPGNPFGEFSAFTYPASKTMLNAITAWLAVELRDTVIKVNSVCPGSNQTDMNAAGAQPAADGAAVIVNAATLSADGPTGSFLDVNGVVAW